MDRLFLFQLHSSSVQWLQRGTFHTNSNSAVAVRIFMTFHFGGLLGTPLFIQTFVHLFGFNLLFCHVFFNFGDCLLNEWDIVSRVLMNRIAIPDVKFPTSPKFVNLFSSCFCKLLRILQQQSHKINLFVYFYSVSSSGILKWFDFDLNHNYQKNTGKHVL